MESATAARRLTVEAIAIAIVLCLALGTQAACNAFGHRRAVRAEPIEGILDAFRTHQIVALGEGGHGNNQAHAFRLALIRDPRFTSVVNDIVVESGSARYQPLMDRFIRGEEVPYAELRRAWQDTTMQNTIWDLPIYEEFFRAVREVNASRPKDRQLRVLLGDPPIDWDGVRTTGELVEWIGRRDTHARDVIAREVLARNRRALVVYGDGHFLRRTRWKGTAAPGSSNVLTLLEAGGTRVFSIWTNTTVQLERLQRDIASWPAPSLTLMRGTALGTLDFKYFSGMETDPPSTMEEQFDAVLYLGPVSALTWSKLSPALCSDTEYTKMRLARMALGPPGQDIAEFRKGCAEHVRQAGK
jgi:hypothetical protein